METRADLRRLARLILADIRVALLLNKAKVLAVLANQVGEAYG